MIRVLALLGAVLCLSGCTAAYIEHEAAASNDAVEASTNSVLVTNILRARDGAPTIYSDISHLRAALQEQAAVTSPFAVGAYDVSHWTGRSLVTPSLSVANAPSFDIAPLNTESFTRGINEPIDVRVFQYYLDRDIPADLLLRLFIDKIEDVRTERGRAVIVPHYNVACDVSSTDCVGARALADRHDFEAKIGSWTHPYLFLHPYKLLLPHGPVLVAEEGGKAPTFHDMAGSESQALTLRPAVDAAGRHGYRYYTVSNNIAFCVPANGSLAPGERTIPITIERGAGADQVGRYEIVRIARNTVSNGPATISDSVDPSACVKSEVIGDYGGPQTEPYTLVHFRSVDGMLDYLGRSLRIEPKRRPINFDISREDADRARFSVDYRGERYFIHDKDRAFPREAACDAASTDVNCHDRTLEILTLVNQLFNLHKSRSDLPSTGAVQVVN